MRTRNANLNANATTARRSRANKTSRNIMTSHVRHIFTQGDQTEQKIFPSRNQFVNCNISIPSKQMSCCNTITKSLIVTTINPIWRSRPVHPGTQKIQFVALKARKTSSLHTIILEKHKQTKQLVVLIFNQVYFSFY